MSPGYADDVKRAWICDRCDKEFKSEVGLKSHQGFYPSKKLSCKVMKKELLLNKSEMKSINLGDPETEIENWVSTPKKEVFEEVPEQGGGTPGTSDSNTNWMKFESSVKNDESVTHSLNPAVSLFKAQLDQTVDPTTDERSIDPVQLKAMNDSIIGLIPPITDVALTGGARVLSDGKVDLVKHSESDRQLFADTIKMYADANNINLAQHASPGLLLSVVSANYIGVPLWEAARESPLTIRERLGSFGSRFRIPLLKRWVRKSNSPDFIKDGVAQARSGTIDVESA